MLYSLFLHCGSTEDYMKKKYIVARYWRGAYIETMCEPKTKKEATELCDKCNLIANEVTEYKVHRIGNTHKVVKLI